MGTHFNIESQLLIQNICNEFKNHPVYQDYEINTYVYDLRSGSVMMDVEKNGVIKHKYLFIPNDLGDIINIAIYQNSIDHEYQSIKSSGLCFGLPVKEVTIDNGGMTRFIDVYIDDYSHLL